MSKTAQIELLSYIKKCIHCEIIKKIYNEEIGSLYGLEANAVRDKSNLEQLDIVSIHKRLIEYVACEKVTGESLCSEIL